MAIAKLKKLNIFFLREATDKILSFLQNLRKVEIFAVKERKKKLFENKTNTNAENIIFDINKEMDKHQNENTVNFKAVLISKLEKSINSLERYEKSKSFLDKLNSGIILKKSEFEKVDNEKNNDLINISDKVNSLLKDMDKY